MPFLTRGKTNWKYILIVVILVVIVGGGILWWTKKQEIPPFELSKIEKPEKERYVKIISPNGGEKWIIGKKYDIKWVTKGHDTSEPVTIFLKIIGYEKEKMTVIAETTNTGIFSWTVPDSLPELKKEYDLGVGFWVFEIGIYVGEKEKRDFDESDSAFMISKEKIKLGKFFIPEDWKTYRNENYGYEIKYPPSAKIIEEENLTTINLPFTPGTTLEEKDMSIRVMKNTSPADCFGSIEWYGIIEINGVEFHYIPGSPELEHAMGGLSFYDSEYFTMKNDQCIMIFCRLSVRNPAGFVEPSVPIPPAPPAEDLDIKVFDQMLSTFKFLE
jgi:hypothetical protein